jgi:hypothetical protein
MARSSATDSHRDTSGHLSGRRAVRSCTQQVEVLLPRIAHGRLRFVDGMAKLVITSRVRVGASCANPRPRMTKSRPLRPYWPVSETRQSRRSGTTSRPLPSPETGLPHYPAHPFRQVVRTTPMDQSGCVDGCFPLHSGLPNYSGESASMTLLSRPAQASLTSRPAGFLTRPRRSLSWGFDQIDCSIRSLVSYQVYRQLLGWDTCSTGEPRRWGALKKKMG